MAALEKLLDYYNIAKYARQAAEQNCIYYLTLLAPTKEYII